LFDWSRLLSHIVRLLKDRWSSAGIYSNDWKTHHRPLVFFQKVFRKIHDRECSYATHQIASLIARWENIKGSFTLQKMKRNVLFPNKS